MRYLATALFALVLGVSQDPAAINGTWSAELRDARIFLQLRTTAPDGQRGDFNSGQTLAIEEVSGLPAGDPRFSVANIRFELQREAGTLAFDGAFRDGRGAGLFTFTPRPAFAAEMAALGLGDDLSVWRRFRLALYDVGPRYVRGIRAEGYDRLTLDEIQRGRNHGLTLDYIRGMKTLGYGAAWEALVRARDHGVTPTYVTEMKSAGYGSLTLDELVRARDHGVTTDYVSSMRAEGFKDVAFPDLVRARDHGVTAEFIKELRDHKIGAGTLEEYIRMRDHGVNAALLRGLSEQGFKDLPIDEVVRAKDHGVTPEYIEDMKGLGFKDLTLQQIVRLRDHGITPGFVNHARTRGFTESTVEELIRLKNRGLWER
jgi:hypothetical protein